MTDAERDAFLLERRLGTLTVEGQVTIEPLGERTRDEILAMSSRYLGAKGGARYAEDFMAKLVADNLHDDHGTDEVIVRMTPTRWRTEVLG